MIRVALLASALVAPASAFACDIALQLSLDVSVSIDEAEYRHIVKGTAAALATPEVLAAFAKGEVWLQIVAWADRQAILLDWTRMASDEAVRQAATTLARAPRPNRLGTSTGLGSAMLFAQAQMDRGPRCDRLVVDISGDGESNTGLHPQSVHGELDPALQINAIATTLEAARFYEAHVLQGAGAFVELAEGYERFAEAMKRKLNQELEMM